MNQADTAWMLISTAWCCDDAGAGFSTAAGRSKNALNP